MYLPLRFCSDAGGPLIMYISWPVLPYSRNYLIAGGELGIVIPIFLNFWSKQKKINTQLNASPIMVTITPEISMDKKKIAIAA